MDWFTSAKGIVLPAGAIGPAEEKNTRQGKTPGWESAGVKKGTWGSVRGKLLQKGSKEGTLPFDASKAATGEGALTMGGDNEIGVKKNKKGVYPSVEEEGASTLPSKEKKRHMRVSSGGKKRKNVPGSISRKWRKEYKGLPMEPSRGDGHKAKARVTRAGRKGRPPTQEKRFPAVGGGSD